MAEAGQLPGEGARRLERFFTIFPTGTARPLAADLNFAPGENRPNLVMVKLGTGGKVSLFN